VNQDRERELLWQVPTLRGTEEMDGFLAQLAAQGETPSAALYQALLAQGERLRK